MTAPFAIDPATGQVRFSDMALDLRPWMPQAEFIAATATLNRDDLGADDGWQRYQVRQFISEDRKLGMFVIFLSGRLQAASFAYAPKDETWDDWSEASELARQKEYEEELTSQLGGKSAFPWGTVSVKLDSKSGGTDIWVEFSE
ncbi:MAG TPA: hypothetical protein VJ723_12485 [Candidatus Angelobacter sp.]|nr:hypothetical protein [Candidatus Angelobacter sp.]